eukprot:445456-Pyramimonas_sp.AAC.1
MAAQSAPLIDDEFERMAAADVESKVNSRTLVDIEGLTLPTPPGLRAQLNVMDDEFERMSTAD